MRNGLTTSEAGKLGAIESAKTAFDQKEKRISEYNKNPKLCKFCLISLPYEKRVNEFCGQSCAAKFNNPLKDKKGKYKDDLCLFCNNPLLKRVQFKFCCELCSQNFKWQESKNKLLSSGIDTSSANRTGKKYLTELHEGKCKICNENEWLGQSMPLVLDHINGNPYDNNLTNLRVICHNCNAQTPTFAGRNKGNGRFTRAKRYQIEKELFDNMKLS